MSTPGKTLKTSSKEGKALLERFNALKVGQPCTLPSMLPGLSSSVTQAFLLKVNKGKYWEFRLFWHSVEVGTVLAHANSTELLLEVV